MSDNKKFIIFLSWSTGVSLVVAYIFSVLEVNNAFVSDEFFFALFSGVFASFFVMFLSEIKRYIDAKRLAEDALYGLLLKMYIELMGEVGNASMFLQNKSEIVPGGLLDGRAPVLSNLNASLRAFNYAPFKKTPLYNTLVQFKQNEVSKIDVHINNLGYLHQAVVLTQLDAAKKGVLSYNPVAADYLVEIALKKIKAGAELQMKAIEGLITALAAEYPKRYNWAVDKKNFETVQFDMREQDERRKIFFEQ